MGLDVYVGTLTRYYSGEWETIVQQAARQTGQHVDVHRPANPADVVRDPATFRRKILAWRDSLSNGLRDHLNAPLDWDESDAAPFFTDKPAWDCYSDLVLWAAYDEHRGMRRPQGYVEDWTTDPAFQASNAEGFRSRYTQLLHGAELWLPCDFPFTFRAEDAGRNPIVIGSSLALLEQLRALSQNTWRADSKVLAEWHKRGADYGAPLETGARFAFTIFHDLAHESATRHLPMKLDY